MNSARKGAKGERELAAILSALFGVEVKKGSVPYLPGIIAPDVYGLPGIHIEVKRREHFSLPAAMRQSQHDAAPGDVPTVCHRPNRCQWTMTVMLSDLPRLADAVKAIRSSRPNSETPGRGHYDAGIGIEAPPCGSLEATFGPKPPSAIPDNTTDSQNARVSYEN